MTNFPSCPLPSSVTGVVNIPAWDTKITELLGSEQANRGLVDLMMEVRHQLSEGADSHVSSPGTTLTQGTNWISEEASAYDRVPGDQCRLMTALLEQGWGSKYQYDTAKNTSPIPHVERKVRPETAEEEQWLAELDLFTAAAITVNHFDKHAAGGCCPHIYVSIKHSK